MPGVARIGAAIAAAAMLLVPAIWNGFPLLQYDTGGYLARWFEHSLATGRSTVYGLFLTLLMHPNFWPAVIVQSALTIWILALLLRTHGFGQRAYELPALTALLTCATTLPWIASILLTDIFTGLAVVALHLLVFTDHALRRWERYALVLLVTFAAAMHSATFALLLALVACGAIACGVFRVAPLAGIARGAGALAIGACLLLGANYLVAGRIAWTPGGYAIAFGRMLQTGIVARYLADHCPDRRLRLCAHRHELPRDADVFLWGGSVFDRLGRFDGLGDEMRTIVLESLRDYPALQAEAALLATARQLVQVGNGEGVLNSIWHTYAIIERDAPAARPAMRAARQQRGEIGFSSINMIEVPIALLSMLLLIPLTGWSNRAPLSDIGRLAATSTLALFANAFVCGALANPHDRYGARLAWIAPLVVVLALSRLRRLSRPRIAAPAEPARTVQASAKLARQVVQ